jgi:hypothetical protein
VRDSDDAERVKRGRIFPWRRTRRSLGRSSYQSWEGRLQYPQLVDCTTATNDAVSKRIGANQLAIGLDGSSRVCFLPACLRFLSEVNSAGFACDHNFLSNEY